jgi:hypothetical protein
MGLNSYQKRSPISLEWTLCKASRRSVQVVGPLVAPPRVALDPRLDEA